jgi:hypothetical protein
MSQGVDAFNAVPEHYLLIILPLMIRFSRFRRGDYPDPIGPKTDGVRRDENFP